MLVPSTSTSVFDKEFTHPTGEKSVYTCRAFVRVRERDAIVTASDAAAEQGRARNARRRWEMKESATATVVGARREKWEGDAAPRRCEGETREHGGGSEWERRRRGTNSLSLDSITFNRLARGQCYYPARSSQSAE